MADCKYKRVILKISGEALAGVSGFGIDFNVAKRIALEIKELVDAMKEAYGVDPSAVAVAGPAVAAVEEGPSKVNVVLTAAGANKIAVIKLVRDLTGLGLKEAKDIADNGGNVKEGIDKEEAEKIKAQFEEAGATVELK